MSSPTNLLWCSVRLYLQLFVGELMSYYDVWFVFTSSCLLESSCLIMMFGSSLPPVVCWEHHNKTWAFQQTTGGKDEPNIIIRHEPSNKQLEVKTNWTSRVMSYYDVRFVFTSSCLLEGSCLIMMFGSSLPLVVCRRAHVLLWCLVTTGGKDEPNIIIRHDPSYKQLEVKTNWTS
jgi:hypothetical protein